jgi:N4-gp56 family major capsid protein
MANWSTAYWDGTYQSKTTTTGLSGVNIYYVKKFLERVVNELPLMQFADVTPLPEGEGKTVNWFRYLNLAASVSSATLTEGALPNAMTLKMQKVAATIAEYGAFAQLSTLLKQTHIDKGVEGAVQIFAEHAANVLDTLCHMIVCSTAARGLAADFKDLANPLSVRFSGTVDSSGDSSLVDSDLTSNTDYGDSNDDLNQSVVTITSGDGYGQQRTVSDYVAASGTMTVGAAWDVNPSAGDTYEVCSPHFGASDTKVMTYAAIKRGVRMLKQARAPKFEGNSYVCLIDPAITEQIMDDEKWINAMTYKDSLETGLFTGELGKFAGVRFVEENNPFIFPVTDPGTDSTSFGPGAAGANFTSVYTPGVRYAQSSLFLGRGAFGGVAFQGKTGSMRKPPIYLTSPGPNDTSQPLKRFSTVGWQMEEVFKGLNPMFGVQVFTKADVF